MGQNICTHIIVGSRNLHGGNKWKLLLSMKHNLLDSIFLLMSDYGGKVFKLIKGGVCYAPEKIGKRDIFIAGSKIAAISENSADMSIPGLEVIDCADRIICPGFIDQHVHITGGGGEEGPSSRIPELMLGDILCSGVTTLVGVLGVDCYTRNIAGLLAKARSLETEGLSTYIYTGSYGVPTATLTGKVITDIAYIDKIIGVGEIALSDYRSSHPSTQMLKDLAYEARVGGMIGSKAGVVHIHIGDGKGGLSMLLQLLDETDFPIGMFVPTHVNRNRKLFEQAVELLKKGGNIDLTAGEVSGNGYTVEDALDILIKSGINTSNVTVSSDGNGSMPAVNGSDGICKIKTLFDDIRSSIQEKELDMAAVLGCVTVNPARILKLFPRKGTLSIGSDADMVVMDQQMNIEKVFAMGEMLLDNGKPIKKGKYEG